MQVAGRDASQVLGRGRSKTCPYTGIPKIGTGPTGSPSYPSVFQEAGQGVGLAPSKRQVRASYSHYNKQACLDGCIVLKSSAEGTVRNYEVPGW
jgi:hypothetical protein